MARLLLVEDDELTRRSAARILLHAGHQIDEAATIGRARELLGTHAYERAILDVRLPDGDGLDLLDWIRARGSSMDVLVVTGQDDRGLAARAFLLGAVLVFKPAPSDVIRQFAMPSKAPPAPTEKTDVSLVARRFAVEHHLSPRQTELLLQVARGTPRRALAPVLAVEENTVKTMVRQILEKTDAASIDDLLCAILTRAYGAPSLG
jgi:two-component system, LuxR family, response regulator FixJ